MDTNEIGEFSRRLILLAELFDVKLSSQRTALYFEALRDLPFEAVVGALNQAAKTCVFFPKPAELRTFAVGDSEDVAENAWILFRSALKRAGAYASLALEDAALAETIVAMFGSWPQACAQEFSSEMWAAKRKEFGRVYRVMRQRNLHGGRYLAGISETENAGRPHYMKYTPVFRIGQSEVVGLSAGEADRARQLMAARASEFSDMQGMAAGVLRLIKGETA